MCPCRRNCGYNQSTIVTTDGAGSQKFHLVTARQVHFTINLYMYDAYIKQCKQSYPIPPPKSPRPSRHKFLNWHGFSHIP